MRSLFFVFFFFLGKPTKGIAGVPVCTTTRLCVCAQQGGRHEDPERCYQIERPHKDPVLPDDYEEIVLSSPEVLLGTSA